MILSSCYRHVMEEIFRFPSQATGSRLGLVLQNVSNIGVGLVIAFVIDWRLSLVMLAFIPLISITGLVEARVLRGSVASDKKDLEKAGKVGKLPLDLHTNGIH